MWRCSVVALIMIVAIVCSGCVTAGNHVAAAFSGAAVSAAAPLVWRSAAPMIALAGVEAGAVACVLAFHASDMATAMIMVELYTVGVVGHRRRSVVVGAITAVGVIAVIIAVDGTLDLGGVVIRLPLVFLALATGDVVRTRAALAEATRERVRRESREREEKGVAERARSDCGSPVSCTTLSPTPWSRSTYGQRLRSICTSHLTRTLSRTSRPHRPPPCATSARRSNSCATSGTRRRPRPPQDWTL